MEADHRRRQVQQHRQHAGIVSEALVDGAERPWRLRIELGEQRREPFQPDRLAIRIRLGAGVDEQVDVEGAGRAASHLLDHGACSGRIARAYADRPKPSRVGHGRGQQRSGYAGHRRLDQRHRELQAIHKRHGATHPKVDDGPLMNAGKPAVNGSRRGSRSTIDPRRRARAEDASRNRTIEMTRAKARAIAEADGQFTEVV